MRSARIQDFEDISTVLGFQPPEHLDWKDPTLPPESLRVGDVEEDDAPYESYDRILGVWDWGSSRWRMGGSSEEPGLRVERRSFQRRTPIYVLSEGNQYLCWYHSRAWALLRAAELLGRRPFRLDAAGHVRSDGRSPLHLPLPIARFCTLIGEGPPGPVVSGTGLETSVEGYVYPFGRRVLPIIERALPKAWLMEND